MSDNAVSAADESLPVVSRGDLSSLERTWDNQTLLYPNQWHNSSEIDEEILAWMSAVPDLLDWSVIGHSYLGKNITVVRITNEQITEQKAKTFIVAEHHAREQITIELSLRFILTLINGYGLDPQITEYLDTIEIYIIPALNPDSLNLVVDGGNHWLRRNMHPYNADGDDETDEDSWEDVDGDGYISSFELYEKPADFMYPVEMWYEGIDNDGDGLINEDYVGLVDLNRNYPTGFGGGDSSNDPLSDIYHGEYAFSEPETQALRDFVEQHRFAMAYSLHSGINTTYFPRSSTGLYPEPSLYYDMLDDFDAILPAGYNQIYGYSSMKLESANSGMWDEWMYYVQGTTVPVTFEVYHNGSADTAACYHVVEENATHILYNWTGIYPYFAPVESYIQPLWEELQPAFDYLLVNTPRIDVEFVPSSYDGSTFTGNLSVECFGHRIDTVDSIRILDGTGSVLKTILPMNPGDAVDKKVTFDLLPGDAVSLRIGNNYTGFAEYLIEAPAQSTSESTSSSASSTTTPISPPIFTIELVVIIGVAGAALVVAIILLKRR